MAKNSFTQYFAKRSDERLQKFLKLHEPETLEKISMPKPEVSTKMVDRRTEHGYNPGDDEKAYDPQESKNEEVDLDEGKKLQKIEVVNKTTGKKSYHEVHASKAFAALNHHRNNPYTKSARIVAENEEINELSKETLKSYGKKSLKSMIKHYDKGNAEEDKAMATDGNKYPEKQERHQKAAAFHQRKEYNREKGVALVTKKLTGLAKRNV